MRPTSVLTRESAAPDPLPLALGAPGQLAGLAAERLALRLGFARGGEREGAARLLRGDRPRDLERVLGAVARALVGAGAAEGVVAADPGVEDVRVRVARAAVVAGHRVVDPHLLHALRVR